MAIKQVNREELHALFGQEYKNRETEEEKAAVTKAWEIAEKAYERGSDSGENAMDCQYINSWLGKRASSEENENIRKVYEDLIEHIKTVEDSIEKPAEESEKDLVEEKVDIEKPEVDIEKPEVDIEEETKNGLIKISLLLQYEDRYFFCQRAGDADFGKWSIPCSTLKALTNIEEEAEIIAKHICKKEIKVGNIIGVASSEKHPVILGIKCILSEEPEVLYEKDIIASGWFAKEHIEKMGDSFSDRAWVEMLVKEDKPGDLSAGLKAVVL